MPVCNFFINVGELYKPRWTSNLTEYGPHPMYFSMSDEAIAKGKTIIKDLARDIEKYNQWKKEAEKEKNYDLAKYCKTLIQDANKQHRAWKLVIGYFVDELGFPYRVCQYWPIDLEKELDYAYYVCSTWD